MTMSILHNEQTGIFSLETAHSLYQMKADATGVLLHLYYGGKTGGDMDYLIRYTDRGFSGNPYELSSNRGYSLDTLPQEYSGNGVGDFRLPAVQVLSENGSRSVDLRKVSRDINAGISGRGGGRPEMIQGSATAPEDQIRSFILGFQE